MIDLHSDEGRAGLRGWTYILLAVAIAVILIVAIAKPADRPGRYPVADERKP